MLNKLKNFFIYSDVKKNKEIFEDFQSSSEFIIPDPICSYESDLEFGKDVLNDIEFESVFKAINKCHLTGGASVLKFICKTPIHNLDILNKRKDILISFEDNFDSSILTDLSKLENDILWLFHDQGEHIETLYNMIYFKFYFMKHLNNNGTVLTAYNLYRIIISPLVGILSPIIYFIVPYFVLRFSFHIKISFIAFLKLMFKSMTMSQDILFSSGNNKYIRMISCMFSLLFYFQGLFNSFEISNTMNKICSHIVNKINNIIDFIKKADTLIKSLWSDDINKAFFLNDLFKSSDQERKYIDSLNIIKYGLFGQNFGNQLKEFKFINKDIIKSILYKTYILDALIGVLKFKHQHDFSYPDFILSDKPSMDVISIRHPSLSKPIDNDVSIGGKKRNNAILTAGNSAGKSVLLKNLLINIILSQTITISCSSKCSFTPFYHINSQINVPDSTGFESLFVAEMHRCKHNLDMLKSLKPMQFSFIVMDEIFNSTNPYEGIASAYSVCKKIASYENNMLIFTTHFNYLTKLAKDTKLFTNYKMDVIVDKSDIQFTYKIKKGINKHHLALELLKRDGFDSDILEEALKLKNMFLCSNV